MKFSIEIDCTPEEVRRFFGVPDVGPMQEKMAKALEDKLMETLQSSDPERLMQVWMPDSVPDAVKESLKGWGQMQKFWQDAMTAPTTGLKNKDEF